MIATTKISTQNDHRGAEGDFAQTTHDDELQVIVRNHQQFQQNGLTPQASLVLKTWKDRGACWKWKNCTDTMLLKDV